MYQWFTLYPMYLANSQHYFVSADMIFFFFLLGITTCVLNVVFLLGIGYYMLGVTPCLLGIGYYMLGITPCLLGIGYHIEK